MTIPANDAVKIVAEYVGCDIDVATRLLGALKMAGYILLEPMPPPAKKFETSDIKVGKTYELKSGRLIRVTDYSGSNFGDVRFTEGGKFGSKAKSASFIREAMIGAIRCHICGAMIHNKSMTSDHVVRKADGGMNTAENAMPTHPYCNSTFKN